MPALFTPSRSKTILRAAVAVLICAAASHAIAEESATSWHDDHLPQTGLPQADVVILGEVHDNPQHHRNQVAAVESVAPAALVFEMLTQEQAARITPDLLRDPHALGEALGWEASGWPDFTMYYPIFAAAPDALVLGGGLERDKVRRALSEGAAAVFGNGAARFGLERPLPEAEQKQREDLQHRAHCEALPSEMLPGMVEAQRLRDAAMARAVLSAHDAVGAPVVLIAGSGHARTDWGVPAALAAAAPHLSVFALRQAESPPEGAVPFDMLVVTAPQPRDDPCEAFR